MNIVNLTPHTVLVPTSLGPWLAEPAEARPELPAPGTLYLVDDVDEVDEALWAPVCIALDFRGQVRRARSTAFAF